MRVRKSIAIGDQFKKLTVVSEPTAVWDEKNKRHRVFYDCRCECGNVVPIRKDALGKKAGSCGCQSRCRQKGIAPANKTHGLSESRIMSVWRGMIARCENPNNNAYHNYGGRGITVCPDWHDFVVFSSWAFANGYSDELEIDRRDNEKGYYPDNCRFVTPRENSRNKRNSIYLEVYGERKLLVEWVEDPRCLVPEPVLRGRVVNGWDAEKAMTDTEDHRWETTSMPKIFIEAFGENKSMIEWADDPRCPVSYAGLRVRLLNGWDPERAITQGARLTRTNKK